MLYTSAKPSSLAWVGFGGNLGNVVQTITAAVYELQKNPAISNFKLSSFYKSAPIDANGDDFINAVACFKTTLKPLEILGLLQNIEQFFGRERPYWHAPRTLDLDLLLYDDIMMQSANLTLPHHAMHERAFVLLPMSELDQTTIIPNHGSVKELLKQVANQEIELLNRI